MYGKWCGKKLQYTHVGCGGSNLNMRVGPVVARSTADREVRGSNTTLA